MITKKMIADRLLAYLQHRATLAEVVAWAEQAVFDADYKDDSSHTIRNILAQLGTADVKAFGLEWKDCESIMEKLGFKMEVKALKYFMPDAKKTTSVRAAKAASKVLRDGRTGKVSKTAAGSALSQKVGSKKK